MSESTETVRRDRAGALMLAVVWVALTIWAFHGGWGEDVAALYLAGHFWTTGQTDLIYSAPALFFGGTPPAWEPAMAELGLQGRIAYPFVYPPLWAAVMAPVSQALSPQAFSSLALVVQVPMIAVAAMMAGTMARPAWLSRLQWMLLTLLLVAGLVPGIGAIHFVQPSITTAFLAVLSLWLLDRRWPVAAGVALALAAALKLAPALFLLVFLIDRQWRAVTAFAVAGAILGLASLVVAGPALHHDFIAATRHMNDMVLVAPGNYSLRLVLAEALAVLGGRADIYLADHTMVIESGGALVGGLATAGAVLTLVAMIRRLSPHPPAERRLRAFLAVALVIPLFGPIGWTHYFLLPLLFGPALPALLTGRVARLALAGTGFLFLKPVFDLAIGQPGGIPVYVTLSCALLLVVLAALVARPRASAA